MAIVVLFPHETLNLLIAQKDQETRMIFFSLRSIIRFSTSTRNKRGA